MLIGDAGESATRSTINNPLGRGNVSACCATIMVNPNALLFSQDGPDSGILGSKVLKAEFGFATR